MWYDIVGGHWKQFEIIMHADRQTDRQTDRQICNNRNRDSVLQTEKTYEYG